MKFKSFIEKVLIIILVWSIPPSIVFYGVVEYILCKSIINYFIK